jgi:hypothetical protein
MSVFSGNTSSSALSAAKAIPCFIKSFRLVNKTGSTANVSVAILYGSTNVYIYKGQIAANGSYVDSAVTTIPIGKAIYVLTDQNLDYYFSISGDDQ